MRTALFLFAALTEADIAWLADMGTVRRFAAGEALIRRGENLDALLILLEGEARVEIAHTAMRRAGESLGEVSLVDTRPASADVIALVPVQALVVRGDVLRRELQSNSGFASRFWRGLAILLANRLREAAGDDPDAFALDDTMLDGLARAGDKFLLLLDHTRDGAA
ncbi:MAG TPA: cyclic nucleotide-binding domain-containing protein [Acetobacteraceae bacterium]|nr:cyclic nucleotide-binding domain-containing protein [Acetobacteraceae bacterium]